MNRYPLWKYLIIAVAFVVGIVYTVPNFFPEVPAVQVSSSKGGVKIEANYTPPKCDVDASARARCDGRCKVDVDPGEIVAKCTPAKLSGRCQGTCKGQCDGRCSGQCDGNCAVKDDKEDLQRLRQYLEQRVPKKAGAHWKASGGGRPTPFCIFIPTNSTRSRSRRRFHLQHPPVSGSARRRGASGGTRDGRSSPGGCESWRDATSC